MEVAPSLDFVDLPTCVDTPDAPDDLNHPVPLLIGIEPASGASSPSSALNTLVDLALIARRPAGLDLRGRCSCVVAATGCVTTTATATLGVCPSGD